MVDLSVAGLTDNRSRRYGKAGVSSWERIPPTPDGARGGSQLQQCTSATAQSPTAMSAKTWHSLLPGTACMAGSLTESAELTARPTHVSGSETRRRLPAAPV